MILFDERDRGTAGPLRSSSPTSQPHARLPEGPGLVTASLADAPAPLNPEPCDRVPLTAAGSRHKGERMGSCREALRSVGRARIIGAMSGHLLSLDRGAPPTRGG